ncbi:MAG: 30S ribosomal protein S17 [Dehalococcoidia bacterium]|nr:30S ribosomal protein S17 [Dehalococcoidia bacterium]
MEKRKVRIGYVVSDKMDKTVVVAVEALRQHPLYKKAIKHSKKYKAHDENNACRIGDKVKILETRPLSKDKRWRVAGVISRRESTEAELADMENDDSGLH